jgi:hypothetical protein
MTTGVKTDFFSKPDLIWKTQSDKAGKCFPDHRDRLKGRIINKAAALNVLIIKFHI